MYLKKSTSKITGRTHLSIAHGYRNDKGVPTSKTIMPIGFVDEFEKDYDDPIAHFTAVAEEMEKERKAGKTITFAIGADEQLVRGAANRKNYGYIIFSKVYHELEIDRFLKNARRHENFKFNTDAIMRLFVFCRLLSPGSKRDAVIKKKRFFESFRFSLDDAYDALTHFDEKSAALQTHLHEKVSELYGRETDLVYYDVTNYYFEIDKQDDLRKKGYSKEHRSDPIVQMGLLMDRQGLPISYQLFSGNTHDSQTLMPMLTEIKQKYGVQRIISVADKALNSGDNIAYNTVLGDGYIYSKSVRGASEDFKEWALSKSGWHKTSEDYMVKSKVVPDAPIRVTVKQVGSKKTKETVRLEQKWVVVYSKKYALRAKYKRGEAVAKALKMIKNPSKYRKNIDYGAAGYIQNLKIDKETGEILNVNDTLILDEEKIADEAKYDGFYAVVSSELDTPAEQILAAYRGLWRIEDSFKVTKSVLGARPVFLRTKPHINAHFLICFVALLIARIVELKLGRKYTIKKITETLAQVECSNIDQNHWLFDFADEVTDDMNAVFGTDFGRKTMTLGEIKKNLGAVKKS